MASWTSADVIQVAPEMVQVSSGTMAFFIDFAAEYINANCIFPPPKDKYAGALLTAHLLVVTGQVAAAGGSGLPGVVTGSGLSGSKTNESVGDVSVGYGGGFAGGAGGSFSLGSVVPGLHMSPYGMLFSMLTRLSGNGIQVL